MARVTGSDDALFRTKTLFAVELHPSTIGNVEEGVKEQLNAHLLRYVDELNGVLLSYSNLEILTKKPLIHPYFPYFHLDVRADVLVFKPAPGMTLVGRVNLLGEDYIGALVLGVFNVTIPARFVSSELTFLWEENKWVHTTQPQHQVAESSYVLFRVEEVREFGGFFQITGSMRDPGTGAVDFLCPGVELPAPPAELNWQGDVEMQPAAEETADGAEEVADEAKAARKEKQKGVAAAKKAKAEAAKGPMPAHGEDKVAADAPAANGGAQAAGTAGEKSHKRRRHSEQAPTTAGAGPSMQAATPATVQADGKAVKRRRKDGGTAEPLGQAAVPGGVPAAAPGAPGAKAAGVAATAATPAAKGADAATLAASANASQPGKSKDKDKQKDNEREKDKDGEKQKDQHIDKDKDKDKQRHKDKDQGKRDKDEGKGKNKDKKKDKGKDSGKKDKDGKGAAAAAAPAAAAALTPAEAPKSAPAAAPATVPNPRHKDKDKGGAALVPQRAHSDGLPNGDVGPSSAAAAAVPAAAMSNGVHGPGGAGVAEGGKGKDKDKAKSKDKKKDKDRDKEAGKAGKEGGSSKKSGSSKKDASGKKSKVDGKD